MNADPRAEYGRRIERWDGEIAAADRAHARIANARLALAAAIAVLAWQAFVSHRISALWPFVCLVAFVVLAVVHIRVVRRMERGRRARLLYERGMARLTSTWAGAGPDGARFLEGHRFAEDLDLYGSGSLFQLLDTARTEIGELTRQQVATLLDDAAAQPAGSLARGYRFDSCCVGGTVRAAGGGAAMPSLLELAHGLEEPPRPSRFASYRRHLPA